MNKQKAQEVLKWIEEHPEEHDQASWGERWKDRTGCGTTMCMAGVAATVFAGGRPEWISQGVGKGEEHASFEFVRLPKGSPFEKGYDPGLNRTARAVARDYLELTSHEEQILFIECATVEDLQAYIKDGTLPNHMQMDDDDDYEHDSPNDYDSDGYFDPMNIEGRNGM